MEENLQVAKEILKKYNQEHLISFYDELNDEERAILIKQICGIDFDQIFKLYEASKTDEVIPTKAIEPLSYVEKSKVSNEDYSFYSKVGENAIKNNEFAVVTMAGGQRY